MVYRDKFYAVIMIQVLPLSHSPNQWHESHTLALSRYKSDNATFTGIVFVTL